MYVRTKDWIYQVESETCDKQGYYIEGYEYDVILKDQVINQSKNLEELCDEVVFYAKGFIKPQVYDKLQKKEIAFMKQMVNSTIEDVKLYYAIWTSKGLIYVAKMNESGDLILI